MHYRVWFTGIAGVFAALLLVGCNSSSSGQGDNTGGTSGNGGGDSQVYGGTYAGLGPLASGSTVEFYELDPMTGQRTTGDAAATATVDERGAYTLPDFTTRWVEVVANEDYLDLYNTGTSYTEEAPIQVTAILDTEDNAQGRNVQLFTHLVAERAKWLLLNSQSESVSVAMARATQEFSDDWALNLPPAALHFFYEPNAPVAELDDYAKLLAASSYVSRYTPDTPSLPGNIASDYAQSRLTLETGSLFDMTDALSTRSSFYAERAISRLERVFSDEDRPAYWQLFARTLSGCEAAKAFSSRTIVCLGDDRDTIEVVIPSGDGTYTKTLYFHPRATGMWALEVVMQDDCDVNWTSYLGETNNISMGDDSTTDRVSHELISRRRLSQGLYLLEVRFDRDECLVQNATLNFRKVATGTDRETDRGLYLLEKGERFSGVVGNYENPTANIELSSTRAYMFYRNSTQGVSDVEFTLDYDNSGAVELDLHVEEYYSNQFGSGFIGISAQSTDESVGQLTQVYELEPSTPYRVWVENISTDTTTSLDDFNANGRRFFDLRIE